MNLSVNLGGGIAGSFAINVRRADGSIRTALPMQSNLITDNGLAFMNGKYAAMASNTGKAPAGYGNSKPNSSYLTSDARVGTGQGTPQNGDTTMFAVWETNPSVQHQNTVVVPPNDTHPNHAKITTTMLYTFTNTGDSGQNVTEVGLIAPTGGNARDYYLLTHAMIKDTGGLPTSITVLQGELLELVYELSFYVDIRQQKGTLTLTTQGSDGGETETQYDFIAGLANVTGTSNVWGGVTVANFIPNWRCYKPIAADGSDTTYDFGKWRMDKDNYAAFPNLFGKYGETINSSTSSSSWYRDKDRWIKDRYPQYQIFYELSINDSDLSAKDTNTTHLSPYFGNDPAGIRAMRGSLGTLSSYNAGLADIYFVLAAQGTGATIPKNDTQILSFTLQSLVTRYEA